MADRISLRRLGPADAHVLASWQTDALFAAHAGWRLTSDAGEGVQWWRESIRNPDPLLLRLAAVESGELVGYVDLYGEQREERELGYVIGPSSRWGHGRATVAAIRAIDHGFEELGLRRIWAEAVAANRASVRVLEKAGLNRIGRDRAESFLGVESHYEQFEVLRSDWRAGG